MNPLPSALLLGLTAALCAAHDAIPDGVEFLRAYMPAQDRETITEERLDREVRLALDARSQFPWAGKVPWELYENNVLPYAVVNEPRDEWREQFHNLFAPLVSACKTGREAALTIASCIQKTLNVRYSTERRIPHQGVKESLQSGKVSCTGQSILLVCALRSVGIPARMAGVLTWNHVRGNHNWVEAWCDGEWKMLEYNEKDFNTPWVMSAISMLDPRKPENAIYATSWKKEGAGEFFPLIWEARYDRPRRQDHGPLYETGVGLGGGTAGVPAGQQADAGYQGWEGRQRQKTAPARRSQVGRRESPGGRHHPRPIRRHEEVSGSAPAGHRLPRHSGIHAARRNSAP